MQIIHLPGNYLIKSNIYNPNTKYNTEGFLLTYVLDNKKLLFKEYYNDTKSVIDNKIYTVECLNKYNELRKINELIIPEYFIFLEGQFKGIMMNFIPGTNLENILYNSSYTIREKLNYLKRLGIILDQIDKLNKSININFRIGDLHEGNIIIDKNDEIKIVDLDSCKICNNFSSYSKYLSSLVNVWMDNKKYKLSEKGIGRTIDQNRNTDMYCYNIMILNTLYQGNVATLDIDCFYNYLNYLEHIGFDKELLYKLSKLYTKQDNENIYEYLDTISKNGYKAHRNIYKIKVSK